MRPWSIRPDERMQQEVVDLLPFFRDQRARLFREAIHALWRSYIEHPSVAYVMGWNTITLAQTTRCDVTEEEIPAGGQAWREVWSDGRAGRIFSQAGLDEELA